MADNVNITAGSGTVIATDQVGTDHYQKIKLVDGTADSSTIVAVDVGGKANALRVAPANDITDATYIGDIKFGEAEPNSEAIKTAVEACQTALEIIDDWDDSDYLNANMNIAGTDIVGGAGAVAAGVQRVTLASDDPAVVDLAAIEVLLGTIDTDTGNTVTALQIIDDWDAVHDSAASTDGPQLMGAYDSTKPTAVADGDAVRVLTDSYGRLLAGVEPQRFQAVYDSADATGEGEVVQASAASTVIVVLSYVISSDVEGWIKLQDEDSTALTGKFWLKAGGGVAITLPANAPIVLGADKDLEVIAEAAGNVSVSVTGYTIPG